MAKLEKLLEQAKGHLDPGEKVLAAIQGTYETKLMGSDRVRTGILLATQARVVFCAKKMGGYDLESFGYDKISSFEQSKNMMGHSVSFYASGNKVHMNWISDQAAMQVFVTTVKGNLHGASQAATKGAPLAQSQVTAAAPGDHAPEDIMGKIRQLGSCTRRAFFPMKNSRTRRRICSRGSDDQPRPEVVVRTCGLARGCQAALSDVLQGRGAATNE